MRSRSLHRYRRTLLSRTPVSPPANMFWSRNRSLQRVPRCTPWWLPLPTTDVLLVDHTYLYSSAVQTIAATLARGELGEVYYYDGVRINLGRFRSDVDVLWDLASHDLAILDYLFDDAPTSLQAIGLMNTPDEPCPLGYLTLRWGQRRIAQIHVSWLAPVKIRRTLIGGSRAKDGVRRSRPRYQTAHLRSWPRRDGTSGAQQDVPSHWRTGFRSGEMRAPLLALAEPLRGLAEHFVACIVTG